MTSPVLLFVTAQSADHKTINRFMLHFRDWENGPDDVAHLVNARNAYMLEQPKPTIPPVPSDVANGWSGASVKDVEDFVRDAQADPVSLFLLLDDRGVRDKTVVVAERRYDDEAEEQTQDYNKVRVPWDDAYTVWANLDIGNMGWEDFCDEERGGDAEWWWVYNDSGDVMSDKDRAKRDEEIRKLEAAET